MILRVIPQTDAGGLARLRVGDLLTEGLADARHDTFKFAVAYMRLSGLNRLADAIQALAGTGREGRRGGGLGRWRNDHRGIGGVGGGLQRQFSVP